MKILHFIDSSYFAFHKKTISELILSLNKNDVKQEVITSFGADLGWLSSVVPIKYWKVGKNGKVNTFRNKFFKYFYINTATGEKSGDVFAQAKLA